MSSTSNQSQHKILVIEDEGEMCLLLSLILDDKGLAVEYVKTLSAARQFLEKEAPALILLDNRLPDGLGVDFISYVKKSLPDVKIIMISGVDPEAEDAALEIGADHFLAKPFTKRQLQESIKHLLN
ncbi:response regulator [Flavitalea sp. BT771]|uniref:response regulator n=1 Tax=Flavitalea sp. BT771 TaxID=3063329 RepID=UPI0026E2190E|nr:response regulator [Flavitalea sp. BT771]MDO6431382.1 response regulator [Flavitalea sp. BT771]MDV6220290.1 response regulator [Flavitalea sp. BT771]